jgi:hypothetical protein
MGHCCNAQSIFFSVLIVICTLVVVSCISTCTNSKTQSYVDYMPSVIQPCPSYYKCGAESKDQIARENTLYANLRKSNTYSVPEFMGTDEYYVQSKDSEPTESIMKRSTIAYEGDMQEGTYTPEDDIEAGMMNMPIR